MALSNTERTAKRRVDLKEKGLKELTGIVIPMSMSKAQKNELRLKIKEWLEQIY